MPEGSIAIVAAIVILFVALPLAIVTIYRSLYRQVGPNEVMVVSGGGDKPKLVSGGGTIINPLTQRIERFSLEIMTIEFVTPEVYSVHGVPIIVDTVAQVHTPDDDTMIRTAVKRFLSKSPNEIREVIKQTLEGHTRAIIGQMTVEDIIKAREEFAARVQSVASEDLAKMGLQIDSFSIRDIRDNQGYLSALGKPQTAEVKMRAAIAEAERARDAQKAAALANQDAEIAKIDAKTRIAEKDRDFRMQQAEYNKSSKQKEAEADLAYDLQKNISAQKVKAEEVQINVIAKMKEIEVQEKETQRKEQELIATVRKPADARKYEIEALANAEQFKLKTTAEGEAEANRLRGLAQADVVRAQGLAEAESFKAKGLAQAETEKARGLAAAEVAREQGIAEAVAMTRKAAAWQSYNQAAIAQMLIEKMPDIARSITDPLSKVDKIVMVSTNGDGPGVSRLTGDITRVAAQLPSVLEALTGMNFANMAQKIPGLKADNLPDKDDIESAKKSVVAAVEEVKQKVADIIPDSN